jgi:Flp pilus assembly CpaE family ATPase
VIDVAATTTDVLVVHLPRAVDGLAREALTRSDRVLEVLLLDVLCFRAATRALDAMAPLGLEGRFGFVVNNASRSEITPGDVQRVFGVPPLVVVPSDRSVGRAQDHGRLVPRRGRVGRAFARLADAVLEPAADRDEVP